MGSALQTWPHFLVTTPTIVATVDAVVATAIVVLAGLAVEAPTGAVVATGVVAFLVTWERCSPATAESEGAAPCQHTLSHPAGRSLNQRIV